MKLITLPGLEMVPTSTVPRPHYIICGHYKD